MESGERDLVLLFCPTCRHTFRGKPSAPCPCGEYMTHPVPTPTSQTCQVPLKKTEDPIVTVAKIKVKEAIKRCVKRLNPEAEDYTYEITGWLQDAVGRPYNTAVITIGKETHSCNIWW